MRSVFLIAGLFLGAGSALAQNVILITMDGVRYKDIFRPEPDAPYLDHKKGFPLARFNEWALGQNHGFAFGTQEPGDEMETGNTTSLSLPGYKALMNGVFERECEDNHCGRTKRETLVDRLTRYDAGPGKVAVFSSWSRIANAAESVDTATRSIGFESLSHFQVTSARDRAFFERASKIDADSRKPHHLPPWSKERSDPYSWARADRFTWALATDFLKTYHPRFTWISLLDTDEYAHRNEREKYHRTISDYDDRLLILLQELQKPEHADFLRNTSFVITTDHGRGGESDNFSDHGPNFFNYIPPGSENVWAYIVPSKSLQESFKLSRALHGVDRKYSQLDIRPTIEALLRLSPRRGDHTPGRGTSLLLFSPHALH